MRAPLVLSLVLSGPSLFAAGFQVHVTAPDTDLPTAIISAEAPAGFPESGVLKDDTTEVPFQKSGANITFVLSRLHKGVPRDFSVASSKPSPIAVAGRKNDAVNI